MPYKSEAQHVEEAAHCWCGIEASLPASRSVGRAKAKMRNDRKNRRLARRRVVHGAERAKIAIDSDILADILRICRGDDKEASRKEVIQLPYKSDAQRRKFHAMLKRGEVSQATVRHWDKASKGKRLPERAKRKK